MLSRARGCLLGLAVGEALGAPLKGRKLPAAQFPELNDGPLDMRPGGVIERRAGEIGWASDMALCLSNSLREFGGYDVEETAKTYARWMPHAAAVPPKIREALDLLSEGRSAELTGRRVWLDSIQNIKDNAALARTAPIGVFLVNDRTERIRASFEDTAITHFMPLCQLAAATFNGIIAASLNAPGERIDQVELLKLIEAELALAAVTLGRKEPDWIGHTSDAADWLREDIRAAQDPDPMLYGPDLHLFASPTQVRVSFRLALWELFHAPSVEAGLLDVVNRGGEADINAAITGALLGAAFGDQGFPELWTEAVLDSMIHVGGVRYHVYHPRMLITLEPKR